MMHGKGKLFTSKGNIYEGEFKNNKAEGYGIFYNSNGDKYEGKFKNNKIERKWKDMKENK